MQRGAVEAAVGDDEASGLVGVEEQRDQQLAVEGRAVDVQVGAGEDVADQWLVAVRDGVVEGRGREGGLCGQAVQDGREERAEALVGCVQAAEGGGREVVG